MQWEVLCRTDVLRPPEFARPPRRRAGPGTRRRTESARIGASGLSSLARPSLPSRSSVQMPPIHRKLEQKPTKETKQRNEELLCQTDSLRPPVFACPPRRRAGPGTLWRIVWADRCFRCMDSGLPFVAFVIFCSNAFHSSKTGTEANEGNKVMQRGPSLSNRRVASTGLPWPASPAPPATDHRPMTND
jgi:hypothetical protein